jgi:hypothetical protein
MILDWIQQPIGCGAAVIGLFLLFGQRRWTRVLGGALLLLGWLGMFRVWSSL